MSNYIDREKVVESLEDELSALHWAKQISPKDDLTAFFDLRIEEVKEDLAANKKLLHDND